MRSSLLLIFVSFLSIVSFSSCDTPKSSTNQKDHETTESATAPIEVIDLSVDQFMSDYKADANAYLIDVRTAEEIAEGKIDGALEMDYYLDDFKDQLETLDPARACYVYCRSGGRSAEAGNILIDLGFKKVRNLKGGFTAYQEANK